MAVHLGRRWGLPSLLIWGNAEERGRAEQIVAAAAGHARLAPKMTLLELAALARRAAVLPRLGHRPAAPGRRRGDALRRPLRPLAGRQARPLRPAARHRAEDVSWKASTRQRRHAPPIYMEAIDVASVCEACDRLAP